MRRARVDSNQKEIVAAFRKFGCSVLHLHTVGGGCPDIAVGKHFKTLLVEIKDGSKPKSGRELTPDEKKFHSEWQGGIYIVESLGDVIDLVRALENNA